MAKPPMIATIPTSPHSRFFSRADDLPVSVATT